MIPEHNHCDPTPNPLKVKFDGRTIFKVTVGDPLMSSFIASGLLVWPHFALEL